MRAALRAIYTIWLRETITFSRAKVRILGMVGQPLLYLLVLGYGITAGMRLTVAEGIAYVQFLYPGVIAMSVLFTSVFSAISIIWDREFGFLKEVLVAPVPRWGVALGKSLGGATVAMAQSVILVALAPIAGISLSPVLVVELLALAFLMSLAMTSLGVAVAARMESMQSFQVIMNFLVMPMYFLSGALFPLASAPAWLKALMVADPLTYGVDAVRQVVFAGTTVAHGAASRGLLDLARETGLVLWPLSFDLAVMALMAVGLTAVAAWSFSREAS